jgi:hypothetical protein
MVFCPQTMCTKCSTVHTHDEQTTLPPLLCENKKCCVSLVIHGVLLQNGRSSRLSADAARRVSQSKRGGGRAVELCSESEVLKEIKPIENDNPPPQQNVSNDWDRKAYLLVRAEMSREARGGRVPDGLATDHYRSDPKYMDGYRRYRAKNIVAPKKKKMLESSVQKRVGLKKKKNAEELSRQLFLADFLDMICFGSNSAPEDERFDVESLFGDDVEELLTSIQSDIDEESSFSF